MTTESPGYKKRDIGINSLSSMVRFGLCTVIWFLLTKYLLHRLGIQLFGLWTLFGAVTAYGGLVDLGITQALVRFVAEFHVLKRTDKINEYITVSLLIYGIISIVMVALLFLCRGWLVTDVLRIEKEYVDVGKNLVVFSGISLGMMMIGGVYKSLLEGMQKIVLSNVLLLFQTLLVAVGSYIAIESRSGVTGLAINSIVVYTINSAACFIASKTVFREMKFAVSGCSLKDVIALLRYSLSIQSASVVGIVFNTLTKIFLTRNYSVSYVGLFEISIRILDVMKGVFVAIVLPVLPLSAMINAGKGKEAVARLTSFINTVILTLSVPSFLLMYVLLPGLFSVWLGQYDHSLVWSTRILLAPFVLSTLISGMYIVFQGVGLAKWNAILHMMNLLIGMPVIVFFARPGSYASFIILYAIVTSSPSLLSLAIYKNKFRNCPIWDFRQMIHFVRGLLFKRDVGYAPF